MKILLVCAGGYSTSMLVERMKESAAKRGVAVLIDACGEARMEDYLPADVVLLGPQMGHAEKAVRQKVGEGVPVAIIEMMDYGMMDGEKVFNLALGLLKQ